MTTRPVDIVLFDLGGVLYDPGGVAPLREMAGIDSDDELWRRWLSCRWARDYEAGRCSDDDFAQGVVNDWSLSLTPDEFLTAFASWPNGPYEGAEQLVRDTMAVRPVGCLSNTNAKHWAAHFTHWAVLHELKWRFLSFELGHVKPDRQVFEAVAAQLPIPPDQVLFLDDNLVNVQGAQDLGFQAERVRGVAQARQALVDRHILS